MRAFVVCLLVVLLAGLVGCAAVEALGTGEAVAATPGDGAAVSDAAIARAERWGEQAVRNLRLLNRARACFGWPALELVPPRVVVDLPGAGDFWRAKAIDYYRRFLILRWRMAHPGAPYCAEDWRPLVRWHWPARLVERAVRVIHVESRGLPAVNRGGLFQNCPWSANGTDPDANVARAYRKFRDAAACWGNGWHPWAWAVRLGWCDR